MVFNKIGLMGCNGFIGSNLRDSFYEDDYKIYGIIEQNYGIWRGISYDVLINANGNSSKLLPENEPVQDFDLTVRKTLRSVFDFTYDTYVYLSSCEVYGDLTGNTNENDVLDVDKMSRYAFSKYLAESIVKKYCKKWLILRINGPVGQYLKKGPIYDIIHGHKLWVSEKSEFQFIHTKYIYNFIKTAIEKGVYNEVFNLSGVEAIHLSDAMKIFGRHVPSPEEPVIKNKIDVKKMSSLVEPVISLDSLYEAKATNIRKNYP